MAKKYRVSFETVDKELAKKLNDEVNQILAGWKRTEKVDTEEYELLACK